MKKKTKKVKPKGKPKKSKKSHNSKEEELPVRKTSGFDDETRRPDAYEAEVEPEAQPIDDAEENEFPHDDE